MTKQELYQKACMLPLLPGVYIIRDKKDVIIYIGKAKRLRTRVSQYFKDGVPHDNKVSQMIAHAFVFDVIVCQSEFEALVLEASQIKQHLPRYNILLKDDKGYSYLKVTKGDWPRLSFVLQKSEDDANYIGPYTSAFAARQLAETAMDCFLLPRCTRRFPEDFGKKRPCLNAHIGKCMAVCTGKISKENYQQAVAQAVRMAKFGKGEILKTLQTRMEEASERLDFETAALLRDQIVAVKKVSEGQKVVASVNTKMDVIAFAGTATRVCAAVLRFRDGRLTDKREFVFVDTADVEWVREGFILQYYQQEDEIPPVIAVDALPEDSDCVLQWLEEKRGTKIQLYKPQRGDVAKLVEMAHTNALERLAREGGRAKKEEKLIDELAQLLGLKQPPQFIESYDISNWGDGTSVCGLVVFKDGKPYKAGYRRFKMKTVVGTDDYASMTEALQRRVAQFESNVEKHESEDLTKEKIRKDIKEKSIDENVENVQTEMQGEKTQVQNYFSQKPDLILLDGGRGQVSVVKKALKNTAFADVLLFGMVKDNHHRTRGLITADGAELVINMNRGVFTFVTAVQDETHRFANAYRKQQMNKKSYSSSLLAVPGVGKVMAKALMQQFKSVQAVKNASIKDLCKTEGVGEKMAKIIYEYFNSNI